MSRCSAKHTRYAREIATSHLGGAAIGLRIPTGIHYLLTNPGHGCDIRDEKMTASFYIH